MFLPRSVLVKPKSSVVSQRKGIDDDFRSNRAQDDSGSTREKEEAEFSSSTLIPPQAHDDTEASISGLIPTENLGVVSESIDRTSSDDDDDDDEPVISYTAMQRWPKPGEPVCVMCGRYGAYIVDKTDQDVCSLECKAKHLLKRGTPLTPTCPPVMVTQSRGDGSQGGATWTYREHEDVAGMTCDQVNALRRKMRIKIDGSHIPRPIMEFGHLRLPKKLSSNLLSVGYASLTPVQMQVIPSTLYQKNLLVCAATGSGKTLSFLLPIILHFIQNHGDRRTRTDDEATTRSPQGLVLAPTRELAIQIEAQAKQLMKGLPMMRTALLVGGIAIARQLHRLRSGIEMIIATPARLNDIIENHSEDIDLTHIKIFVLDEVDCLLSMGFESQVAMIVEELPVNRQNLMFSATIPSRIEKMAKALMQEVTKITIGDPGTPCEAVKHTVLWVEETSKKKKLLAFLRDERHFNPPVVIFVSSKKGSLLLADTINKSSIVGATAVGLHGDMVQDRRSEIVQEFLEGKHSVLVATSVLARGVDLVNVKQVFIFDFPFSLLDFIHQVGRAGRMGSPGNAITFINNNSKSIFFNFVNLLGRMGVVLPCQLTSSPYLALQREKRKRDSVGSASKSKKQKLEKDLLELISRR